MVVHTYSSLWKIRKRLYNIEKVKIPIPGGVEYAQLGYYLVGCAISVLISSIFQISYSNFIYQFGLFPAFFVYAMQYIKLDGKSPHRFGAALIRYACSNHRFNRYRPVMQAEKYRYDGEILKVGEMDG